MKRMFLLLVLSLVAAGCGRGGSSSAGPGTPERHGISEAGKLRLPPTPGLRPTADGVLFRLTVRGPGGNMMLSLEQDGRVVRVDDTSVLSSTSDYTTWRLSPTGVDRLMEAVESSAVLTGWSNADFGDGDLGAGRSVGLFIGGIVIEAHDLDRRAGLDAAALARRDQMAGLVSRLLDQDWLADEMVEPPGPFVPEVLTVLARPSGPRSGLRPDPPFRPWPYEQPVEAMAESKTMDPNGEERLVLCLRDAYVAPLFALLTGVNHAHLLVDDGRRWELNVQPHTPGYRLGDRCAPVPRTDPVKVAVQKLGLRQLLVRLLEDLEAVGADHDEVFDTAVREQMADALVRGFVDREPGFELPGEFGMFSADGDRRVREALEDYLTDALLEAHDIKDRAARMGVVWDESARSAGESSVDDLLGAPAFES